MQNFEQSHLVRGGLMGDDPASDALPQLRWREMSQERGWEFAESLCGFAQPAQIAEDFIDHGFADLRVSMEALAEDRTMVTVPCLTKAMIPAFIALLGRSE
jgi:hypothetical protein